jgi:hypothetical protein
MTLPERAWKVLFAALACTAISGCTPITYDGRAKKFIRENSCHPVSHSPATRRWDWVDVKWVNDPPATRWRCDGVPESIDVEDVNGKAWQP